MSRRALLIATSNYAEASLHDLSSALSDSDGMHRVLSNKEIGGYEITRVTNAAYHIIGENVGAFLADLSPGDTALIYLSCHGLRGNDGELYFAAANTRTAQLEDTSLPASRIARQLDRSPCRQVALILDCCFSGAFSRSFLTSKNSREVSEAIRHNLQGEGRAILTATTSTQVAYEHAPDVSSPSPVESIFTRVLVEGLETGDADIDCDGVITVSELFRYLSERIHSQQTPTLSLIAQHGEIVIANSSKRLLPVRREVPSASQFTKLLPVFLDNFGKSNRHPARQKLTGLTTGLATIDRHTSGVNKGEVWLISSARPIVCSAFIRRMAAIQAFNKGLTVSLLSLDEDAQSTISRLISARTGLRLDAISNGVVDPTEWAQLTQEISEIADSPLAIIDLVSERIERIQDLLEILRREIEKAASVLIAGGEFMAELLASVTESRRALVAIKNLAREFDASVVLSVAADDAQFGRLSEGWGSVCEIVLRPVVYSTEEYAARNQHIDVRMLGLRGNPYWNYHVIYEPEFDRLYDDGRPPSGIPSQVNEDFPEEEPPEEEPPWDPEEEESPWGEPETRWSRLSADGVTKAREEGAAIMYALSDIIRKNDPVAGVSRDLEGIAYSLHDSSSNDSIRWWKGILERLLEK